MIRHKRKWMFTKKDLWIHLILWGFYTTIWVVMFHNTVGLSSYTSLLTLGLIASQMAVVYANVYVFIPKFLSGRQRTKDVLAFLAMLAALYFIARRIYLIIVDIDPYPVDENVFNTYLQPFLVVLFSFFPVFILFMYEGLKQRNTTAQLEREKVQTELKFLRGQINPHFLFNALNSIYHLIPKDPSEAQKYMMVFSDMLKYQLYDTHNEFVPLTKELDYIKRYATMEKLRKGKNLELQLDIEPAYYLEIPSLTLLTLTENAFKHVSNRTDIPNRVKISLMQDQHALRFAISNTIESQTGQSLNAPSGIGLENVKRRLELYYQNRFTLHTRHKDDYFEAELVLNVNSTY